MALVDGNSKGTNSSLIQPDDEIFLDALFELTYRAGIIGIFASRIPSRTKYANETGNGHSENDLMAVMWDRFLQGDETNRGNPENSFFAPMTKAAMKCVDAAEQFVKIQNLIEPIAGQNWSETSDKIQYIPLGASKRGWTSWLVGAVDNRVQAMTPIVMSMTNIQKHLHRLNQIYNNNWPFTFEWLVRNKILGQIDDQGWFDLMNIIDPFAFDYGDKFIAMFSATNDQFFVPDFWGLLC